MSKFHVNSGSIDQLALKLALAETAKPKSERDRAAVDALVAACFTSSDYKEGQAAFKEKRNPDFKGE